MRVYRNIHKDEIIVQVNAKGSKSPTRIKVKPGQTISVPDSQETPYLDNLVSSKLFELDTTLSIPDSAQAIADMVVARIEPLLMDILTTLKAPFVVDTQITTPVVESPKAEEVSVTESQLKNLAADTASAILAEIEQHKADPNYISITPLPVPDALTEEPAPVIMDETTLATPPTTSEASKAGGRNKRKAREVVLE